MSHFLLASIEPGEITIVVILGCIALSIITISTVYFHNKNKLREKTKQEIAAYVAEGSMTPEDAVRIIKAGADTDD
jgi:hypothetical protein